MPVLLGRTCSAAARAVARLAAAPWGNVRPGTASQRRDT